MGRSSRPLPPQLNELREEGLPEDWDAYWHGKKDTLATDPRIDTILHGSDSEIRKELLALEEVEEDDPLIRALFDRGWQDLQEAPGISAEEDIDQEELWRDWEKYFRNHLQRAIRDGSSLPPWSLLHFYSVKRLWNSDIKARWKEIGAEWDAWAQRDPAAFRVFMNKHAPQLLVDVNLQGMLRSPEAAEAMLEAVAGKNPFHALQRGVDYLRESERVYLLMLSAQTLATYRWDHEDATSEKRDHVLADSLAIWLDAQLHEHENLPLWATLRQDLKKADGRVPSMQNLLDTMAGEDIRLLESGNWSLRSILFSNWQRFAAS